MKIQTVNVIKLLMGSLETTHSFTDDKDGNIEAEEVFTAFVKSNELDISQDELEFVLDDGHYQKDGMELFLTHSE